VYLLIAVALGRRGRRARPILLAACCAELAWVLTVGAATIDRTDAFGDQTVWSRFGEGYGYLPLALPLLTLAWLTHGHPRPDDAPATAQPAPPRQPETRVGDDGRCSVCARCSDASSGATLPGVRWTGTATDRRSRDVLVEV
jgi:hypothetical protein